MMLGNLNVKQIENRLGIEFPDPYKNIDHLIDQIDSELEASYKVTIDFVKKEVVNIANKI